MGILNKSNVLEWTEDDFPDIFKMWEFLKVDPEFKALSAEHDYTSVSINFGKENTNVKCVLGVAAGVFDDKKGTVE